MAKISLLRQARHDEGASAGAAHAADAVGAALEALAAELAATAVERDRAGGHAAHERERIRASGLLRLSIPTAYGGTGAEWSTVLAAVRRLAEVDSALVPP